MNTGESRTDNGNQPYIGNLSKSTTEAELNVLFAQTGDVTSSEVIKDRHSVEPRGFALVTMSAQTEADKAVSVFNMYSLSDHVLKVSLSKPREQRGLTNAIYEP